MKKGSQTSHIGTDSAPGKQSKASGQARKELDDSENAAKLQEVRSILYSFKAKNNSD